MLVLLGSAVFHPLQPKTKTGENFKFYFDILISEEINDAVLP